ncbi:MAG TPA: bacteriohopanetetrol glucosamine biosynthesis glycosyltransferase HpnI [Acidobacteriaceae bacterium]|nr:bacteriohopanetetrol glucosamine biosynthesis glycosyltransferase HpnI [Acidobacteriaceae bacterium]
MIASHTWFTVAQWIAIVFTALTLTALVYSILVFRAARAYTRSLRLPLPASFPAVSILKPVKGVDLDMYEAFASHCRQDYPGEYEILFGAGSMGDPAVALIEQLQREFPQQQIRLLVCPDVLGANGKVSNLVKMVAEARYDHLLINDSDIRVTPHYLRHVMPAFALPSDTGKKVGMVTALYRGHSANTLGSRLEALGISTDFIPGALTARWMEKGLRFGLGSTLAMTREALDAIGGLLPLVDHLADDYEMGARIYHAGYRVELAREVVETSIPAYTFSQFLAHQLRWARGVRDARPLGYFGLLVTFGLPWALANVIASAASLDSIALLSVMLCVRFAMALSIGVGVLDDRATMRDLWLLPLRDVVALAVWFWSFADNAVVWRGERFHLRGGKLIREKQ